MASINGLGNSNSLSSTSSLRGYGGLASGLDRDTLIEQLTYGTRSKIAKQQQNKQSLTWQQEVIRSITDKTYAFTDKYTSYASPSNLTSSNLFSRNQITAVGANSKFVSVTGKANAADLISVLGVKQMAEDAQIMGGVASNGILSTGSIKNDFQTGTIDANLIEGQSFIIKQGKASYLVTMGSGSGYKYGDTFDADTLQAINDSFAKVDMPGGKNLGQLLKAKATPDGKKLILENVDDAGNDLTITSGMGNILKNLGILDANESIPEGGIVIHSGAANAITAKNEATIYQKTKYTDYVAGKSMTFQYNGASKTIEIDKDLNTLSDLKADLQKKLDSAFGKGRVKVDLDPPPDPADPGAGTSKLTFKTVTPDGADDKSSILTISDADIGLMGKTGFFGIDYGQSNRINMGASLLNSGAQNAARVDTSVDAKLIINGKEIPGVTWDSSVEEIITAINEDEELGVKISYLSNSDRFVVTSKEKGASGQVKLEGNVAEYLFGSAAVNHEEKGQDAIITVKYPGDTAETEITRNSNSFTVDGLNLTLKGTFGYTGDVYDNTTEAITFDARVDTAATAKVVQEMIDSFNEIIGQINTEVGKKPDRDYSPLTDEQREGMSEDQIKAWETKAKEGLLFNDSDLRAFADGLRFTIPAEYRSDYAAMGISISTEYGDKGKLVFNETKFKAALEADPDKVKELLNREQKEDEKGHITQSGGLMTQVSTIIEKYAGTKGSTKGALIERAGSIFAPTSVNQNSIQKKMDEIDATIKSLKTKLKTEQDRYIRQFTSMETLISQMNSQSSYLSQMSGGL